MLHSAISNLKLRHKAALESSDARLRTLEEDAAANREYTDNLRRLVNDLTGDYEREAYGRRREVSLRLSFLGREESLAERFKRWLLRAHECLNKAGSPQASGEAFANVVKDAESLLVAFNGHPPQDEDVNSSLGRIIAAQAAVTVLQEELHRETRRRILLEQCLAGHRDILPQSNNLCSTSHSRGHSLTAGTLSWPSSPSARATLKSPTSAKFEKGFTTDGAARDRTSNDQVAPSAPKSNHVPPNTHGHGEYDTNSQLGSEGVAVGAPVNPMLTIDGVQSLEADGSQPITLLEPILETTVISASASPDDSEVADADDSTATGTQSERVIQVGKRDKGGKQPLSVASLSDTSESESIQVPSTTSRTNANISSTEAPFHRQKVENFHFGSFGTRQFT